MDKLMVASVVAILKPQDSHSQAGTLDRLKQRSGMELGNLIDNRVPIVIECTDSHQLRIETDWLRELPGIQQSALRPAQAYRQRCGCKHSVVAHDHR